MKVRWGRVAFAFCLFLIIAALIWLRRNAYMARSAWYDVQDNITDVLSRGPRQVCIYAAIGLGILLFFLWIISRVRRWFRT